MTNKPSELPVISSLIKVESELSSLKTSEFSQKRIDENKSVESIKIGDNIPQKLFDKYNLSNVIFKTDNETEPNHILYIIGIILFLFFAGGSYYFYINYRNKKPSL
jgi:hypothetical protein